MGLNLQTRLTLIWELVELLHCKAKEGKHIFIKWSFINDCFIVHHVLIKPLLHRDCSTNIYIGISLKDL